MFTFDETIVFCSAQAGLGILGDSLSGVELVAAWKLGIAGERSILGGLPYSSGLQNQH